MENFKSVIQKRVKLKKPNEFNFNKIDGHQHFCYDLVRKKLGLKRIFIVFEEYSFYSTWTYHLKNLDGEIVLDSSNCTESFPASWFNILS